MKYDRDRVVSLALPLYTEAFEQGVMASADLIARVYASLLELPDTKRQQRQRAALESGVLKMSRSLKDSDANRFALSCTGKSLDEIKTQGERRQ